MRAVSAGGVQAETNLVPTPTAAQTLLEDSGQGGLQGRAVLSLCALDSDWVALLDPCGVALEETGSRATWHAGVLLGTWAAGSGGQRTLVTTPFALSGEKEFRWRVFIIAMHFLLETS